MMNIDGIGEETAAALYKAGFVNKISDLYNLTEEQLLSLDGFGPRSAERVLDGIEASRQVPFERVVYALSIPGVGETTAKKIARAVGNIDNLMNFPAERLESIEDVGPTIARSIKEYFEADVNRANIDRMRQAGVQMEIATESMPVSNLLAGKSFVISGVFSLHSRDEYKAMIEQHGGKNVGSISKKTDYVLAGENMGPAKLEKAGKLGIPIIDENTFIEMIQENPQAS